MTYGLVSASIQADANNKVSIARYSVLQLLPRFTYFWAPSHQEFMKLSIIIVNYNVRYFLEQALLSVRKALAPPTAEGGVLTSAAPPLGTGRAEVWVVDNNSVDDSVRMVKEKFPEVHLIANRDNVGFSTANNQAIRQSSGEYVLLLNPDTVVEEDTFEKCIAFMDAHPDAGALGVRMIDGSGKFLPESKRGFPSPWVAFCRTFGLSTLFPKSSLFNQYHLGYLDEHEVHPVDVLSGAFMLLRRSALDKAGLLDEAFFMYGEDIDLSYRIKLAGYQNYYFPETTILHYKGESTKKGSLNYVRAFYQAMIIFAKKHFVGRKAQLFVAMLRAAIYLRAFVALLSNGWKKLYLPLLDGLLMFGGLHFLKNFWASYHFHDPDYYNYPVVSLNFLMYTGIWLLSVWLSGGYDAPGNLRRLARGLLLGTLLISAIYGFLDSEYRNSRALILLGTTWVVFSTAALRVLLHFWRHGNLNVGRLRTSNLIIVGGEAESDRVRQLLYQAGAPVNYIGKVSPNETADARSYLGTLRQLGEAVLIYKANEIIFCSKDLPIQDIMHWMAKLGPGMEYKIAPEESLSIIGSHSKNEPGELYTIDIRFAIADLVQRRQKRLLDFVLACFFLITLPLHLLWMRRPGGFLANVLKVLAGQKTWVGYAVAASREIALPSLRPGVLSPLTGLQSEYLNAETIERLNLLYAKDYSVEKDLDLIWRGYRDLGN